MKLKNKKILVTGGAGFIGSHLVDTLAKENKILVLDDFSSGKMNNLAQQKNNIHVEIIRGSILNAKLLDRILRNTDIVFHLAVKCLRISLKDPLLVHNVNATGTLLLLQKALKNKVKRFIYVSSSEVYGTAQKVPMSESHPLSPTTPYGVSKLAGELYAKSFFLTHKLPVVIVRPFNTYGPRAHFEGFYGEVVPKFVLRTLNNKPLIIFGDGQQTRDFTFVQDIVTGIKKAAESDKLIGKTINIAYGTEVSINGLARYIKEILKKPNLKVKHLPPRPGDVKRHFADISKAKRVLGYKPTVDIKTGLRLYIDYLLNSNFDFKEAIKKEVAINW